MCCIIFGGNLVSDKVFHSKQGWMNWWSDEWIDDLLNSIVNWKGYIYVHILSWICAAYVKYCIKPVKVVLVTYRKKVIWLGYCVKLIPMISFVFLSALLWSITKGNIVAAVGSRLYITFGSKNMNYRFTRWIFLLKIVCIWAKDWVIWGLLSCYVCILLSWVNSSVIARYRGPY